MISYLHRLVFGIQAVKYIHLPDHGIPECSWCHAFLRTGFALSLMGHLSQDHKMHEDAAIDTAIRMLDLVRMERKRIHDLKS